MTASSMIELNHIAKQYGDLDVIRDASLNIDQGEFVVLVGPSGSGKSTLLRMVAGLEDISGGECRISGKVVNALPPKERGVAMVFQNYALYPHMTVYDNLAFALKVQGLKSKEIDERVRKIAQIVQLEDYLKRKPSQLSGGQRQRVAMARAMIRDTGLFLFDEPLSNLDAKLRTQMRVEIRKLHDSLGATSIYVTHDQTEAMTLADKIVVLDGGNIEQVGSPQDLYENPQTKFVAGFLGSPSMNFLEGSHFAYRADTCVGIRPENLHLAKQHEGDVSITVHVDHTEYLGSSVLYHCRIGDEKLVVEASAQEGSDTEVGHSIELFCSPEHLLHFDGNQRIGAEEARQ